MSLREIPWVVASDKRSPTSRDRTTRPARSERYWPDSTQSQPPREQIASGSSRRTQPVVLCEIAASVVIGQFTAPGYREGRLGARRKRCQSIQGPREIFCRKQRSALCLQHNAVRYPSLRRPLLQKASL